MNSQQKPPMHEGLLEALNAMRRSELVEAARALIALPADIAQTDAALVLFRRLGRMTAQALSKADGVSLPEFIKILLLITPGVNVPPAFGSALAVTLRSLADSPGSKQEADLILASIDELVEVKRPDGRLLEAILEIVPDNGEVGLSILNNIFYQWRLVGYEGLPGHLFDRLVEVGQSHQEFLVPAAG